MTVFIKMGNTFRATPDIPMDIHPKLPAANFVLKIDDGGFYFERVEDFELPPKLYGETLGQTGRILSTYADRSASTGVLLAGEKGSGKTLLAKNISIEARKLGMPTIIINSEFHGDGFNTLIQEIHQPCVILFDEFEKVYDNATQERMLTLLDGVFPTKKLFILTCNHKYKINEHMVNRPGRIFYRINYESISPRFVREYCEDNLVNKSYINQIVKMRTLFHVFNFDMLKAIVEEMNRYDEAPQDALKMLNVDPDSSSRVRYDMELRIDGVKKNLYPSAFNGSPIMTAVTTSYMEKTEQVANDADIAVDDMDDENEGQWKEVEFKPTDIVSIDEDGNYTYVKDGMRLTLTKPPVNAYSYMDHLTK